jgi:hypothetical protein
MSNEITNESFLKDVESHLLTILKDDGVYRHIKMKKPNSSDMYYEIITYPNFLVYSGDMGCFVFSRLEDMFNFFRMKGDEFRINPGYWGEKLEAVDRTDGASEWSQDSFEEAVNEHLNNWIEYAVDSEYDTDFIEEQKYKVEQLIYESREHECHAVAAMNNWSTDKNGVDFDDFWESGTTQATSRYIWCCYAIVWAISKYDEAKSIMEKAA